MVALAGDEVVAALGAMGIKGHAEFIVAGASVGRVVITAGDCGKLLAREIADGIAFEKEGFCLLLGSHHKKI